MVTMVFAGCVGGWTSPQPVSTLVTEIGTSEGGDAIQKVSQEVIEALQKQEMVDVIIALVEPPSMGTPPVELATLKAEIASLQDQVLSALEPAEFRVKHKYQAIPALAGTVTEAGLAKLAAHPKVMKIDLDVGGTGGSK
jgi:hypothetical protein